MHKGQTHIDEDRLAAVILEEEGRLSTVEVEHLQGCPLCERRVTALKRLAETLVDLHETESARTDLEDLLPPNGETIRRRAKQQDRLVTLAALAAAALVAGIVPGNVSERPLRWTDSTTWTNLTTRTIRWIADLPEATSDSLLAVSAQRKGVELGPGGPAVDVVDLEEEGRRELFRILQERLSDAEPANGSEHGGGI